MAHSTSYSSLSLLSIDPPLHQVPKGAFSSAIPFLSRRPKNVEFDLWSDVRICGSWLLLDRPERCSCLKSFSWCITADRAFGVGFDVLQFHARSFVSNSLAISSLFGWEMQGADPNILCFIKGKKQRKYIYCVIGWWFQSKQLWCIIRAGCLIFC